MPLCVNCPILVETTQFYFEGCYRKLTIHFCVLDRSGVLVSFSSACTLLMIRTYGKSVDTPISFCWNLYNIILLNLVAPTNFFHKYDVDKIGTFFCCSCSYFVLDSLSSDNSGSTLQKRKWPLRLAWLWLCNLDILCICQTIFMHQIVLKFLICFSLYTK